MGAAAGLPAVHKVAQHHLHLWLGHHHLHQHHHHLCLWQDHHGLWLGHHKHGFPTGGWRESEWFTRILAVDICIHIGIDIGIALGICSYHMLILRCLGSGKSIIFVSKKIHSFTCWLTGGQWSTIPAIICKPPYILAGMWWIVCFWGYIVDTFFSRSIIFSCKLTPADGMGWRRLELKRAY